MLSPRSPPSLQINRVEKDNLIIVNSSSSSPLPSFSLHHPALLITPLVNSGSLEGSITVTKRLTPSIGIKFFKSFQLKSILVQEDHVRRDNMLRDLAIMSKFCPPVLESNPPRGGE